MAFMNVLLIVLYKLFCNLYFHVPILLRKKDELCRFVNDVLQNLVMKEEPEATSSSLNFEAANQVVENEDSICFGEYQFRGRMGKSLYFLFQTASCF